MIFYLLKLHLLQLLFVHIFCEIKGTLLTPSRSWEGARFVAWWLGGHLTTHHSSRGLCVYIDIGSDIPRFIIGGCLFLLFRLKFPPRCSDHLLDIFCWNLLLLKSEWLIIGSKRHSDSRIWADICFLWVSWSVGLGILPILRFLRTLHFNWDMYLYYNNLVG